MWGLPESGIKLVSPALAGGFFTTETPEKPSVPYFLILLIKVFQVCLLGALRFVPMSFGLAHYFVFAFFFLKSTSLLSVVTRCSRLILHFIHCWWACTTVQPLCKTVWLFLRTLNIVTMWPRNSTPRYILNRNETSTQKLVHRCSEQHCF